MSPIGHEDLNESQGHSVSRRSFCRCQNFEDNAAHEKNKDDYWGVINSLKIFSKVGKNLSFRHPLATGGCVVPI
jgi:hypothetical protein